MEFQDFKPIYEQHVKSLLLNNIVLFITDINKDIIWDLYLSSFPKGSNDIFRERREHDCNCCKRFIRAFGNVVVINDDYSLTSVWDVEIDDPVYAPVMRALSKYVKSRPITNFFVTKDRKFGVDSNKELSSDGNIIVWNHFYSEIPDSFLYRGHDSVESQMGRLRDVRNVFKRSLDEITGYSVEVVLELIAQNSLYRGEEWKTPLKHFLGYHETYQNLNSSQKENYAWLVSHTVGPVIGKIRNHSIGTLLIDLSADMDINEAVRKYEKVVAPENYQRPKEIYTPKMVERAQQTIKELGLTESLKRRFARMDDITTRNTLFSNRDARVTDVVDVFDLLKKDAIKLPQKLDGVSEISVSEFIENVLPKTRKLYVHLENRHTSNLVSLLAPVVRNSTPLFKWDTNFSWIYNGDLGDSTRELVKAAGGDVSGILRFSIRWNDSKKNNNDFDAHCYEPNGNHIWFRNKGTVHLSSGKLDVDWIEPKEDEVAVENITWTDERRMLEGTYKFLVNCYSRRKGRDGFSAELEFKGEIYTFEYPRDLRQSEYLPVVELNYSRQSGIKIINSLDSSVRSRELWGLKSNQFHEVNIMTVSPNYWDDNAVGNKHYLFMLKDCKNDTNPRGMLNEQLRNDLRDHRRVFEALGGKMSVPDADDQLSGLGFSSTKRNSVVVKVEGNLSRTMRIMF